MTLRWTFLQHSIKKRPVATLAAFLLAYECCSSEACREREKSTKMNLGKVNFGFTLSLEPISEILPVLCGHLIFKVYCWVSCSLAISISCNELVPKRALLMCLYKVWILATQFSTHQMVTTEPPDARSLIFYKPFRELIVRWAVLWPQMQEGISPLFLTIWLITKPWRSQTALLKEVLGQFCWC